MKAACLLVIVAVLGTAFVRVNREKDKVVAALSAFKAEQAQRQADRKLSAPALVDAARALTEKNQFKSALGSIRSAVEYDPELAEARLIYALLLIQARDHVQAAEQAAIYQQLCPGDRAGKVVDAVARQGAKHGAASAAEGELLVVASKLGMPMMGAEFNKRLEDQLPLYKAKLDKAWPGAGTKLTITPDRTLALDLSDWKDLVDLTPLVGIPLTTLDLRNTSISDLSPLKGMPLRSLSLCWGDGTRAATDLTPLAAMELSELWFSQTLITTGIDAIRNMKSLRKINDQTPADFWKKYDAGEFKAK